MFSCGVRGYVQDDEGLWMFGYSLGGYETREILPITPLPWSGGPIRSLESTADTIYILDYEKQLWRSEIDPNNSTSLEFVPLTKLPRIIQITACYSHVALLDEDGKVWIDKQLQNDVIEYQRSQRSVLKVISDYFSSPDTTPIKVHDGFVVQRTIEELPRISFISFVNELMMATKQGDSYFLTKRWVSPHPQKLPGTYDGETVRSMQGSYYGSVVVDGQGSAWCRDKFEYEKHDYLPEILYSVAGGVYILLLDKNGHVWAKEFCNYKCTNLASVFDSIQPGYIDCYTKFVKDPKERKFQAITSGAEFAMGLQENGTMLVSGFAAFLGLPSKSKPPSSFIPLQEHPLRPKLTKPKPQKSALSVLPELQ